MIGIWIQHGVTTMSTKLSSVLMDYLTFTGRYSKTSAYISLPPYTRQGGRVKRDTIICRGNSLLYQGSQHVVITPASITGRYGRVTGTFQGVKWVFANFHPNDLAAIAHEMIADKDFTKVVTK